MKNYLEITLLDNSDIGAYELWSRFYIQLHLALVEQQSQQGKVYVGISFPDYRYELNKSGYLGSKLRLFAEDQAHLEQLNLIKLLSPLADYMHCTSIREVPRDRVIKYVQYRRQHIKGGSGKLARRRSKRHAVNLDEATKYYQNKAQISDLPYIRLKSLTTQQVFRLYIEKREHSGLVREGFGTYGLSNSSTVPEF